jgi:hypothetical protein
MKRIAYTFGALMLVAGIAGFIPALAPNGLLFGLFAVDAMHNVVHLVTGLVAVLAGAASEGAARNYFRIFGVVYAVVAVLGLVTRDGQVLGMANNMADVGLHIVIAAFALYMGFAYGHTPSPPRGTRGPDLRGT